MSDRDDHQIIAEAFCKAHGECPCERGRFRCHAQILYMREAARAVVALKRADRLRPAAILAITHQPPEEAA